MSVLSAVPVLEQGLERRAVLDHRFRQGGQGAMAVLQDLRYQRSGEGALKAELPLVMLASGSGGHTSRLPKTPSSFRCVHLYHSGTPPPRSQAILTSACRLFSKERDGRS